MMERIHNNRQALVLGIAVLFLLLLVPYMLMIRPQTEDIAYNDSEIARLQQENDIFQKKIDELKAAGAGSLTDEQIVAKLPLDPDQEQIVTDLYNVGLDNDITLLDAAFSNEDVTTGTASAQVADATTSNQVKSVYVTANIQGSYEKIKLWMSAIQNLPRITMIEQFTLNKPYSFKNTLLDATVTFKASYLPPAAVADPAATDAAAETDTTGTETDDTVTPAP